MSRARWTTMVVLCGALAGCSTRTASYSDTATIPAPTFTPVPARPGDSPQLDAIVLRDTAGLESTDVNADPALLPIAMAQLLADHPEITALSDLYFDDGGVWFGYPDPAVPGRQLSAYYDGRMSYSEPRFDEEPSYPIGAVKPDAIAALVADLLQRFPTLRIGMPRFDVGLSYDLGISWNIELEDGRGTLATVFADPDGTVIAVDMADD